MTQRQSIWSALCRCVVVSVKARQALWFTLLLMGLVLSGCGGDVVVAPVSKHAKGSRWSPVNHTVTRGETLYSIAFQYGQDYRTLARRNRIKHPYTIYVGQKLKLAGTTGPATRSTRKSTQSPRTVTRTTAKPATRSKTEKTSRPESSKNTGTVRWRWPTQGKVVETFSSQSSTRKGIDIAGRLGQAVTAASAGKVVYSGSGLRGYGKLIIVKHNERYLSAYAHNRKLLVKEGDTVKTGQQIAEMGRSGADRVKLHFEIRREGNPVNPMSYLPKRRS
ncbi:peptidoglycan DD-metalloendopeptidase family protein [Sulfuriflexus mobilis]|uniref:peptidoglycan DD-metalloendopeptidase family protein n=1 Tax=Sulfuriflexus mobilis TaxID=1811807 RepID=UPI000F82F1D0|nr:peptidoglycan DD-metalloendopeptidase family protein [Sulfuriflexus mobilis]